MPKEWRGKPVYQVTEIVRLLADELQQAFGDIWVEGEISGFKRAASGHCYFSLKDASAALKTVMFRTYASRMPFEPENGMTVLARGKLSLYEASGDLQLYATIMEPSGVGAMQMAFEQAKRRLMEEGLTDPGRKRPIPPFPGRVAVVTSTAGAALRDVLSVLRRRNAAFDVVISPALVQGSAAPASLKAALEKAVRVPGVEVVLLTRGGGSMEDLWAFNDEALARLVAGCPVPVISAVGHEVDTVLTDLTCDLRAPTPSVAAELLTSKAEGALDRARDAERRMGRLMVGRIALLEERLAACQPERLGWFVLKRFERAQEACDRFAETAGRVLTARIAQDMHRVALCRRSLSPEGLRRWIDALQARLEAAREGLRGAAEAGLERNRAAFSGLARLLHALSPLAVIGRGYAAAFDEEGRLVQDAGDLAPGDTLSLALKRGGADCRVLSRSATHVPDVLRKPAAERVDGRGGQTLESGFEEADRG